MTFSIIDMADSIGKAYEGKDLRWWQKGFISAKRIAAEFSDHPKLVAHRFDVEMKKRIYAYSYHGVNIKELAESEGKAYMLERLVNETMGSKEVKIARAQDKFSNIKDLGDDIGEGGERLEKIKKQLPEGLEAVVSQVQEVAESFLGPMQLGYTGLSLVQGYRSGMYKGLSGVLSYAWDTVKSYIGFAIGKIKGWVGTGFEWATHTDDIRPKLGRSLGYEIYQKLKKAPTDEAYAQKHPDAATQQQAKRPTGPAGAMVSFLGDDGAEKKMPLMDYINAARQADQQQRAS